MVDRCKCARYLVCLVALILVSCGSDCRSGNFLAGKWHKTDVNWVYEFRCDGTIRGWYGGKYEGKVGEYRIADSQHVEIKFGTGEGHVFDTYDVASATHDEVYLDGPGTMCLPLRRID